MKSNDQKKKDNLDSYHGKMLVFILLLLQGEFTEGVAIEANAIKNKSTYNIYQEPIKKKKKKKKRACFFFLWAPVYII